MEREEFEALVRGSLASLPDWFLEKLENIDVVVEDEPDWRIKREMRVGGGTLLGLYQGVPLSRRGFWYGNVLPDKITLYMGPILRMGGTGEEVEARVREVVIHEVGHYFGLSDADMKRLERGE